MPKMRTIEQAIAYIKEQDKDTSLTKNALRKLIINHQLPIVKVGSKYLINIETLEKFLLGDTLYPQNQESPIRKLSEKLK